MKNLKIILVSYLFSLSFLVVASSIKDDPVLSVITIDQLEVRTTNGEDSLVWEMDAWIGQDLNKFWIKAEGERVNKKTQSSELQLLYSKAVTSFWDIQFGIKKDFLPKPSRNWGVIAAKGIAPYLFEVDASLFIGHSGRVAARLEAEYEYMLTQKWVLSPEAELNIFTKDDESTGSGKGLSDIELGLRLRYEIRREFAPYVGINWEKKYGNTADFSRSEGEDTQGTQIVAGVRFWF